MEGYITISTLNDFIFCPMSIYFHNLYESNDFMYQDVFQIEGKQVHNSIDNKTYSSRNDILKGLEVYSIQYNICGKIDLYFQKKDF